MRQVGLFRKAISRRLSGVLFAEMAISICFGASEPQRKITGRAKKKHASYMYGSVPPKRDLAMSICVRDYPCGPSHETQHERRSAQTREAEPGAEPRTILSCWVVGRHLSAASLPRRRHGSLSQRGPRLVRRRTESLLGHNRDRDPTPRRARRDGFRTWHLLGRLPATSHNSPPRNGPRTIAIRYHAYHGGQGHLL
jgi:hypothetical protein